MSEERAAEFERRSSEEGPAILIVLSKEEIDKGGPFRTRSSGATLFFILRVYFLLIMLVIRRVLRFRQSRGRY